VAKEEENPRNRSNLEAAERSNCLVTGGIKTSIPINEYE
jgi:hypothetical protein